MNANEITATFQTGRHFVIQPRGDCAKLREALKKCLLYITCVESVGIGTITLTLNDKVKLDPKKIIKLAQAALAKPWRNCDKYTSLDEARNAYMAINEMPEGNRDEDMRQWLCDFHHWLFALAKEGGDDGK